MSLFKGDLEKEGNFFSQIEIEEENIVVNSSFQERYNENILLQFNAVELLNNLKCTFCTVECDSILKTSKFNW